MTDQLVDDRPPTVLDSPRPTLASASALLLPNPPTDEERDAYLGPQHRWVGPVSFVGYCLIVISVSFFVARHLWAAPLLVPLAISTVGTSVSLVTSSRRRRDSLVSHRAAVDAWEPPTVPSVDVFLPSAGEDLAVLRNTYAHVARLHWPGKLTVLRPRRLRSRRRSDGGGTRLPLPVASRPRLVQEGREPAVRLRALDGDLHPHPGRRLRPAPGFAHRARALLRRPDRRHRAEPAVLRRATDG